MEHEKKYQHKSARKSNWDYRSPGFYFVTIRTKNHQCYFGEIVCDTQNFARLRATEIGKIAGEYWMEISKHFPFVIVDEFIIMPDHLHGILRFTPPVDGELQPNTFGPQSRNLASVIRGFKSAVTKYATMHNIEFGWQPRYHDHVIRSVQRLQTIRNYIYKNPINWIKKYNESIISEREYFL